MQQEAVIIANGQFPQKESVINILKESEYLVCCDGAIEHLEQEHISPEIIVGDLDSFPKNLYVKYHDKIVHIQEQDSNDLSKAFNYLVDKGFTKISILGATGKRDDHTMANISLLYNYNQKVKTDMITDYGTWTVIDKSSELESQKGQQVSLFSNKPNTKIYSKNLKYPLKGMIFDELWKGTLNESIADTFSIEFEEAQILIFREFIS